MPILRRYGVSDTIFFPMITRAAVDFATSSVWTPVQSDTRVQIDTASASYATNLVVATGSRWSLVLTAAELTGKKIGVTVVDAATKAVEDQDIEIETYGSPLAQQGFDYTVATITLSQPALDQAAVQIVNTVWATGSRTLSSFGTLQGDVVNAVWATPSRTLSSFGTLQGDVVNAVWATPSRTITGTGTDAIAAASLAAAAGSKIADIVLRRTAANARASADGDAASFRTLLGGVSKLVNKVAVNGANLEIMQENDTTVYGTQVISTDSGAAPIVALDTT